MKYIVSAVSDIGLTRQTNQDCIGMKVFTDSREDMAIAVLCDGMGGLSHGELASAVVVNAFMTWAELNCHSLCRGEMSDDMIFSHWQRLIDACNVSIGHYGKKRGIDLGTTVAAILMIRDKYYTVNVGDTRIYEVSKDLKLLTRDHTLVAGEVEKGNITAEEARHDSRRNILLQCVGASEVIYPDYCCGDAQPNTAFVLCSDGLHHELTDRELYNNFHAGNSGDRDFLKMQMQKLVELCKMRQERDNITVGVIKTRESR